MHSLEQILDAGDEEEDDEGSDDESAEDTEASAETGAESLPQEQCSSPAQAAAGPSGTAGQAGARGTAGAMAGAAEDRLGWRQGQVLEVRGGASEVQGVLDTLEANAGVAVLIWHAPWAEACRAALPALDRYLLLHLPLRICTAPSSFHLPVLLAHSQSCCLVLCFLHSPTLPLARAHALISAPHWWCSVPQRGIHMAIGD